MFSPWGQPFVVVADSSDQVAVSGGGNIAGIIAALCLSHTPTSPHAHGLQTVQPNGCLVRTSCDHERRPRVRVPGGFRPEWYRRCAAAVLLNPPPHNAHILTLCAPTTTNGTSETPNPQATGAVGTGLASRGRLRFTRRRICHARNDVATNSCFARPGCLYTVLYSV